MSKLATSAAPRLRILRLQALALLVLSCGGASLSAGPLADPTRPPANLATPAPGPGAGQATAGPTHTGPQRSSADAAALAAARQAAAAAADPPPPLPPLADVQLQSVQSPARGPAVAIINGQLVKVGDAVAGRRITRIDAQGVMLHSSAGHERLWLLGDNTKQAAGSIPSSRRAQYTPAQDNPEASAGGEASPRADRSSPPAAVSLARRTQP